MKITEQAIKSLKPPSQGNAVYWDEGKEKISGFGVCITANGAISFVLNYRVNGRQRRYTIGRWPECSALRARQDAGDLRRDIRNDGRDPVADKEAMRAEPFMSDLARGYMEEYALKNKRASSIRNDRQMIDKIILPAIKHLKVLAVTKRDIERLHASLKSTPYRANRVLALLSKMFVLAKEWNQRADNPVHGVERYKEDRRETWLSIPQLRQLEKALSEYQDQEAADALRLLIVTGAREGEVLSSDWSQFDLQRGIWTKPSHHTKQKKIEHVPLSRAALSILSAMRERNGKSNYLFPGKQVQGKQVQHARVTLRRPWVQILKAAGLSEAYEVQGKRRKLTRHRPTVRIHDLRHTFASHLVSGGESLYKVGKLLGHTSMQTTERYAHVDDKALRASADAFGKVYRRAALKG